MKMMMAKIEKADYMKVGLTGCLAVTFAVGWALVSSIKQSMEYSQIYFGIAFAGFMASYIAAYSAMSTTRTGAAWRPLNNDNLWLYRILAFAQAFTAGVMTHIFKLTEMAGPYTRGQGNIYEILFAVFIVIALSTWFFNFVKPRTAIALMPVMVFVVGALLSSVVSKKRTLIPGDTSAWSLFNLFGGTNTDSVLSILAYIIGASLKYSAYAALLVGFTYALFRPYWTRKCKGYEYSGALNGFIASVIVVFPCFPANVFGMGPAGLNTATDIGTLSVIDALKFHPFSFYALTVWSWIIGNFIVHAPSLFSALKGLRRAQYQQQPAQRQPVQTQSPAQASYRPAPQAAPGQSTANKVTLPTKESRASFINSLYGQQDALARLWDNTIYPVLSGQRQFGNAILLGPTGVGKTETAKIIANLFYDKRLLRFDMNQYGTEWEATRLFGAAPGYVGFDAGGSLPRGLRDLSPCIILFDEIEKAHPSILQTLLQLTGEGYAKDSTGQRFDAQKSIILMTSNIWPERANELWSMPQDKLKKDLKGYISSRPTSYGPTQLFSPEFLGRVNTVAPYKPFSKEIAALIITNMLARISNEKNISISNGSDIALAEAIDVSEGFRGLENSFDNWVRSFLTGVDATQGMVLEITKKSGKIYIVLKKPDGEITAQTSHSLQKGYALDIKKIEDWQNSPLKSILGQDAQIAEIIEHLKIAASGFVPSMDRPIGIFLLAGPTGVGKTETSRALAKWLFDGRLIKKDMGEYKSPYDGARLFGDRTKMGDLTKEVQELGGCVVLLDEIEKANEQIFDTLLSLFDDGSMGDAATNLKVSFKNTIIVMTTNLEPDSDENTETLAAMPNDKRRDAFAYHFKKELLGRINKVLIYNELPNEIVSVIIKKRVENIVARKAEEEGISINVDKRVYDWLADKVQSSAYGVRGSDEIISNSIGLAVSSVHEADNICVTVEDGNILAKECSKVETR